jgi:phosphatidylethanolamine-binding protein (PEBP) family uncharacterized protein
VLQLASAVAALVVTAPFPNNGTIPKRYTCDGANVSPVLRWKLNSNPFVATTALEIVDLDAPGGVFIHAVQVGQVRGRNTFGKVGYSGPCPPTGAKPHRYVFRIYALRRRPALRAGFTDAQFHRAIRGLVVAQGQVVGRYGR